MKLIAQYTVQDLLKLAEQDLKNKGLHLAGEPDNGNMKGFILTLSVEQFVNSEVVPESLPAPKEKKVKSPQRLEKEREYKRRFQEKKKSWKVEEKQTAGDIEVASSSQLVIPESPEQEVVAPTTFPFRTADLFHEPQRLLNGSTH